MAVGLACGKESTVAVADWVSLPSGHDITLKANVFYAAIASVRNNHTQADILQKLQSLGLRVLDYGEYPARQYLGAEDNSNYRRIETIVLSTRDAGIIPWSSPVSFLDETHLIKAWWKPYVPGTVVPPGSYSAAVSPLLVIGGIAIVGIAAYYLHNRILRR